MRIPTSPRGPAAEVKVKHVMTGLVIAVRPEDTVDLAIQRVIEERIGAVPVLDHDGHAVGILGKSDLLHAARLGVPMTAQELMIGEVFAVHRDASLALAAAIMAEKGFHRLVVVDEEGRAVGILSAVDVLRWIAVREGYSLESEIDEEY